MNELRRYPDGHKYCNEHNLEHLFCENCYDKGMHGSPCPYLPEGCMMLKEFRLMVKKFEHSVQEDWGS